MKNTDWIVGYILMVPIVPFLQNPAWREGLLITLVGISVVMLMACAFSLRSVWRIFDLPNRLYGSNHIPEKIIAALDDCKDDKEAQYVVACISAASLQEQDMLEAVLVRIAQSGVEYDNRVIKIFQQRLHSTFNTSIERHFVGVLEDEMLQIGEQGLPDEQGKPLFEALDRACIIDSGVEFDEYSRLADIGSVFVRVVQKRLPSDNTLSLHDALEAVLYNFLDRYHMHISREEEYHMRSGVYKEVALHNWTTTDIV